MPKFAGKCDKVISTNKITDKDKLEDTLKGNVRVFQSEEESEAVTCAE